MDYAYGVIYEILTNPSLPKISMFNSRGFFCASFYLRL